MRVSRFRPIFGLALGATIASVGAADFSTAPVGSVPTVSTNPAAAAAVSTRGPTPLFADRLLAQGQGVEVRESQFEAAFIAFRAGLASQGRGILEAQRPALERQVLERLVHVQLLSRRATDEDRARAQEAAEKAFTEYRNRFPSEAAMKRALTAQALSLESFRTKLYEESLCNGVIDRLLRPDVHLDETQVKRFYEENASRFALPEQYRLSQILFLTQEPLTQSPLTEAQKREKLQVAEKVLGRLRSGEDFAGLAKEYSEDPNSRDKGGELPPLAKTQMAPELEAAASALAAGGVSGVVTSRIGFHVIKLLGKTPARTTSFEEARKEIREYLVTREGQKAIPDLLKRLREEAQVRFLSANE